LGLGVTYLHFHDCLSGCINLLEFLRYKVKTEYRENAVLMVISLFDFGTTFMYSRSNKFWSSGRQCHSLTQRKMLHCKTLVYINYFKSLDELFKNSSKE
jgi:hypothetical protein